MLWQPPAQSLGLSVPDQVDGPLAAAAVPGVVFVAETTTAKTTS